MKKIFLLISFLFLTSCVAKQEVDTLNYQLSMEQQKRVELDQKIRELESQLGETNNSLRQEISQSSQPVRFNQANIAEEMRTLRTELAKVQGMLEELSMRTENLEQSANNSNQELARLAAREKNLSRNLLQTSSQLGLEIEPDQTNKHSEAVQTARTKEKQPEENPQSLSSQQAEAQYSSAQELYKRALESFYAKDYATAQSLWGEFTKAFPDNPLTPNAYFWHGEAAFQQKNYAQAVLSYQQVISNYKKSNKYPPALLKQGISFFKLDKKEAGEIVLKDLISQMPESFEASRAKTFLKNPD